MDIFKYIKFENSPGEYGDSIPIGSQAKYIDIEDGITVENAIGNINYSEKGSIGEQLKQIQNQLDLLQTNLYKTTEFELIPKISQDGEPWIEIYRGKASLSGHTVCINYRITVKKEIPADTIILEFDQKYAPKAGAIDSYIISAEKTYLMNLNKFGRIYYPDFSNLPNIQPGIYNFSFSYNI